jgi:iron complex transport system substrate-binding protein
MYPQRIVCLSAESADICVRVGAGERLAAVSAFASPEIRQGRTVIGGFSTYKRDDLLQLAPDLIIAFSDVQAEIVAQLVRNHCTVLATNQRSLQQIGETILLIGRAVGCANAAEALAENFETKLDKLRSISHPRPRVYFEEWNDPLISGIEWVSEAISIAGGDDVFFRPNAKASCERRVEPSTVCAMDPEIIFASWCGKRVDVKEIAARHGWEEMSAVREGEIHPIGSEDILQPGPRIVEGNSADARGY